MSTQPSTRRVRTGSEALNPVSAMLRPESRLPEPLTSLIGREQELADIRALLRRPGVRLVTMTGPGGVGKTRLALEAAAGIQDDFRDGVLFVELAPLSEPTLLTQAVASAAGVREQTGVPLVATLQDFLRSQHVLLVLDGCERLVGACAELAERLLRSCPDLRILATSLEALRIAGEENRSVLPLSAPDPGHIQVELLESYAAVRLFVERVNSILPGFAVTSRNAPAIAYICQQLDGIPLAIELAAAWAKTLDVDQIAARLEDRFQLLTAGNRTATPRHQTLRAAIEWSYELLGEEERTLFNRLSVFAGGFALGAVDRVCADEGDEGQDLLHGLHRLVDKSLVIAEDHSGERRYRLLETLRLYARERLVKSGEAESIHRRHADYYLALAELAEPGLWGSDVAAWLTRLETEHDNLREALRWSVGRGEAETALRLGASLARFWQVRGHTEEGLQWLQGALLWTTGVSVATRARALDAVGLLARHQADLDQAGSAYEQSLALRRERGDPRSTALVLNNLGVVEQLRGNNTRAVELHEESLALFREMGDEPGVALSLLTLGSMAQLQGDLALARKRYEESLALFRARGDKRGVGAALNNLGNLCSAVGDATAAESFYEEGVSLFREIGDKREAAACLNNLARLAWDGGNLQRAAQLARESLVSFHELGDKRSLAGCLDLLGAIASAWGTPERAVRHFAAAEALRQAIGLKSTGNHSAAHERTLASLRTALGEDGFAAAWTAGSQQSLEETINDALAGSEAPRPVTPVTSTPSNPLTRREREVAALVARGLTNRQIAAELFIAERTADTHVEHILEKLGLHSRARVAVWAMEQGLVEASG